MRLGWAPDPRKSTLRAWPTPCGARRVGKIPLHAARLCRMGHRQGRGRPPHEDLLTPAEWRVVESVRHGMSNPEIARRQRVSTDAIKFHVANALQKLGFASRR